MCAAQTGSCGNSKLKVRLSYVPFCLAVFCLAAGTNAIGQSASSAALSNSCIARANNSEKIRDLLQAAADHPTAGVYNTLGALFATSDNVACAIPAFRAALRLDVHNWESHYNLGLALLRRNDSIGAKAEFRAALEEKPDSAAVHFALGSLLEKENKRGEALSELENVLKIDSTQSEASLAVARIESELGNVGGAISTIELALARQAAPEQAAALQIALAHVYGATGDRNKALEILKTLATSQPTSAEAHFSLGEFEISGQESHPQEAISEYQQALRLDPNMEKARISLVKALISVKRYDDALPIAQECVQRHPEDALAFYLLGVAKEGQLQLREAAAALRHAAELDPTSADTKVELGGILAQQGHRQEAIAQFQMAARLAPQGSEIHQALANLLENAGQHEAAKEEGIKYARLRKREENRIAASKFNEEGNDALRSGDTKAAVESYRKAAVLTPADAKLHYNISLALEKLGDEAGKRDELLTAVRLNQQLPVAQNQLGLIDLQAGRNEQAEARFKKALSIDPEYAEAKSNLGVLYSKQGKNDEAVRLFQEAIANEPKYSKPYVNLGLILAQRGSFTDAEGILRVAIQVNANDTDAFSALGMLLAKTGHGEDAIKAFSQAVSLKPNSADAHLNLGIALVDQYNRSAGFREFSEAERLQPNSPAPHYNLGRFYFETGKYEEAGKELQQACRLQPKFVNALYFLALTEKQNNNLERSTELFSEVVMLQPDNADAHYLLGQNLQRLGRSSEAVEHWKAALAADPNHSQALFNLAKALKKSADPQATKYQERFEALQQQQQISDRVQQLGNFALEAANAQNWPQALEQMSEAIQLCGNCPQAAHLHRNLGLFYARTGNIEGAEKELHSVLEMTPGDPDAQKALVALASSRTAQAK